MKARRRYILTVGISCVVVTVVAAVAFWNANEDDRRARAAAEEIKSLVVEGMSIDVARGLLDDAGISYARLYPDSNDQSLRIRLGNDIGLFSTVQYVLTGGGGWLADLDQDIWVIVAVDKQGLVAEVY